MSVKPECGFVPQCDWMCEGESQGGGHAAPPWSIHTHPLTLAYIRIVMPRVTATGTPGKPGCDVIRMVTPHPHPLPACRETDYYSRPSGTTLAAARIICKRVGKWREEGRAHEQHTKFICVLFMCRVFLDNCIFHSLCSSLGQQQGEEVRQTGGAGGAGDHLPPLHLYLKTQHKKHCWH